jgi:molybdopterin synthase catalytic subunit
MKIIQIVGRSNTGKTTFVKDLIRALSALGPVGAVKHLGHHIFALEPEKDTTAYYEADAAISCGIDDEKVVVIGRENDLDTALHMLCDAGIQYAIIEGLKTRPFPRIVMGDLESENVVVRNPTVDDVIGVLDRFEDYFTVEGLVKELKREHDVSRAGAILTFNGIVRELTGDERTEYMDFDADIEGLLEEIRRDMTSIPGIIGVRFHHRKGRLYAGEDITYLAILAERRQEAFAAVARGIDRLKRELHDKER